MHRIYCHSLPKWFVTDIKTDTLVLRPCTIVYQVFNLRLSGRRSCCRAAIYRGIEKKRTYLYSRRILHSSDTLKILWSSVYSCEVTVHQLVHIHMDLEFHNPIRPLDWKVHFIKYSGVLGLRALRNRQVVTKCYRSYLCPAHILDWYCVPGTFQYRRHRAWQAGLAAFKPRVL